MFFILGFIIGFLLWLRGPRNGINWGVVIGLLFLWWMVALMNQSAKDSTYHDQTLREFCAEGIENACR